MEPVLPKIPSFERGRIACVDSSARSISKTLPKLPPPMSRVMCRDPKIGSYRL